MFDYWLNLSPLSLAFFGGLITLFFSILGAGIVLFFKNVNKNIMDYMIALSAGVMLAAAFFSLLNPAIELANNLYRYPVLIITLGFILGSLLIFICNKILNRFFNSNKVNVSKIFSLVTSITLHNIPEGLVVGVAFGTLIYDKSIASLVAAISLTIGIALQNFPEGAALSLPLRKSGLSTRKSFTISSLSALVEPISAFIGALIVVKIKLLLPIILVLAAGAMIYVTSMELIPECEENKNKDFITLLIIIGFSIMMVLELILG